MHSISKKQRQTLLTLNHKTYIYMWKLIAKFYAVDWHKYVIENGVEHITYNHACNIRIQKVSCDQKIPGSVNKTNITLDNTNSHQNKPERIGVSE